MTNAGTADAREAPPYHAGSPLGGIGDAPTAANFAGRARCGPDGRLRPSPHTRRVGCAADASGADFLCVEDALAAADCARIVAAFDTLRDRIVREDPVDPYWSGRYLWGHEIAAVRPDIADLMLDATHRMRARVEAFYRLAVPLWNDLFELVQWRPGQWMPPHADRANPDGSPHGMPWRAFGGILYLNDDYAGGELYFTAQDIAVKPRRGMFVGFTGGFHHEHAVTRIESGAVRLTMPTFYTFDAQHADWFVHPK
jgi:hypothetical protein